MSILRNEVNKILKGIKEGDVSKQQELIESTCNFLKLFPTNIYITRMTLRMLSWKPT